jgi:WS/DGAT/MGAT family acyltransferase
MVRTRARGERLGMTRLSTMDSSFLRVETPTAHMHVGWLSWLDLPAGQERLDVELLVQRLAARLHLFPRFRQRVVRVPLGMAEPVWRDDPGFDIRDHVSEADAGRPVDEVVDELLSTPLDRNRPLWEILVVPRAGEGRAAIAGKVHHAMVDGIAAVELGVVLLDASAEPPALAPEAWEPAPAEGGVRLAADAVADTALAQFRAAGRLVALGRAPGQGIRVADTMRRAALSLADDAMRPAPASSLNVPIGPRRTLVTHGVHLDRLLELKRALGATLNDVVLTACAGALHAFARRRGEEPTDLRVMVPVNVRDGEGGAEAGNKITFAFLPLPVSAGSPLDRLAAVTEAMGEIKGSGRIAGSAMLLRGLGALPEPLKDRAARLAASPRLYNLTISNVPGPRMPLYIAGARVRSIVPVIPIPDDHALAIGVLTYDERAQFGFYADPDALPRVRSLPILLEDAIADLELAADRRRVLTPRTRPERPRPSPGRRSPERASRTRSP